MKTQRRHLVSRLLVILFTMAGAGCGGNEVIELAPVRDYTPIETKNAGPPRQAPKDVLKNTSARMQGPPSEYSKVK